MPMRIGTQLPRLDGATEWFGDYLFDSEGKLKSFAAGERGLDMLKTALDSHVGTGSRAGYLWNWLAMSISK